MKTQQDNSVRFMFLRGANQNPVGVLLMKRNPDTKEVKFAVALANPKDSFDKELGVKIATGRLNKKPQVVSSVGTTFHQITKDVMSNILQSASSPMATLAAKNWLDKASAKEKASDEEKVKGFLKYGLCLPPELSTEKAVPVAQAK